jgi:hypothetical protein
MSARCFGLAPRPSRDFVPAADSLSCARKKISKESAPAKPPTASGGCPAMLETRGPHETRAATLCSNSRAESEVEARKRAPQVPVLLGGLEGEPRNSQQPKPTAKPGSRSRRGISLPPFSLAEQSKVLRPRAQLASRTDSAQLFEQSVAARVLRGASRPWSAQGTDSQSESARRSGVVSLPTFLSTQESRSPAGANSRHRTSQQREVASA